MKPRLRKTDRLWYCWIDGQWSIGVGYTPKHAYHDWLMQAMGAA